VYSTMSAEDIEGNDIGGLDSEGVENWCSAWSSDDGASIPIGHVPSRNQEACMILILWAGDEENQGSVMITYNKTHWEMTFQPSS